MQMTTNSTCQYHELLGQKIAGIVHALSDSLRGIRGSSPSCRDCRDCRDFLDIRSDAEDLNEVGYLAPHLVEERLRASTDASVRAPSPEGGGGSGRGDYNHNYEWYAAARTRAEQEAHTSLSTSGIDRNVITVSAISTPRIALAFAVAFVIALTSRAWVLCAHVFVPSNACVRTLSYDTHKRMRAHTTHICLNTRHDIRAGKNERT